MLINDDEMSFVLINRIIVIKCVTAGIDDVIQIVIRYNYFSQLTVKLFI